MIYVSTSCVKHEKIKDSVLDLVENGFRNIELSGGTRYYDHFEDDLLELKEKYNLNYLCHNYFPPPQKHFVLNIASLDETIHAQSVNHLKKAIRLSEKLGAKRFGFHAGFFLDIKLSEIGKKISKTILFDKTQAIEKFCKTYNMLTTLSDTVELYIENNVFSSSNALNYDNENFLMLTCSSEYEALQNQINFKLLLDVAHLKVSSKTLGLDFQKELTSLITKSDYIHISDNDGLHDTNKKLESSSNLVHQLRNIDLSGKIFTLEVYEEMDEIKKTYQTLKEIMHD